MQKVYYHVSSYISEGQILTAKTKNNFEYRQYVSTCDVSSYHKFVESYQKINTDETYQQTEWSAEKWMCEAIFEYVRKKEYIDKPSRIWGLFLSKDLEKAQIFKTERRPLRINKDGVKVEANIYCIEIPNQSNVHAFDMNLYTEADIELQKSPQNEMSYEYVIKKAKEYWSGCLTDLSNIEYLISGDIVVGKRVSI